MCGKQNCRVCWVVIGAACLVRLLRDGGAVDVLVDIGRGMELSRGRLDGLPYLTGPGRGALGTDKVVEAGLELGERVLDVAALSIAGAEESGVDSEQDPRAALEENGPQNKANPQQNLEPRNDRHGAVIVLLNE